MLKNGPILLIEDDRDDFEIIVDVLKELRISNKLEWFSNTRDAFNYIMNLQVRLFLILCDINLPGENGIEFKRRLDSEEDLRHKSVPFVFYSTSAEQSLVNEAFSKYSIQGFFKKLNNYHDIKNLFQIILNYWSLSKHPTSG